MANLTDTLFLGGEVGANVGLYVGLLVGFFVGCRVGSLFAPRFMMILFVWILLSSLLTGTFIDSTSEVLPLTSTFSCVLIS